MTPKSGIMVSILLLLVSVMMEAFLKIFLLFAYQTQVPLAQQQLLFNGREIPNSSRLNAAGVGDNDLLMLVSARAASR